MNGSYLNIEILKAERKRIDVFISFLVATLFFTIFLQVIDVNVFRNTFSSPFSYPLIIFSGFLMILLLISGRIWLQKAIKSGKTLPRSYFWYTVFIEIFIPSFWLVTASVVEQTSALLDSPVIFVYFILIIVSSLHLDFWVSLVMGLIISVFVTGFTYWVTQKYPMDFHLPLITYYARSILFFISGWCAGFVANELKRRLAITYSHIKEKEEIEGLFNQQVSKEVVEALKEKKDFSARLEVTLLFLDIRDFTILVQHLPPEEVNKFQNDFFGPIIEIVNDHKGIVNQIIGDGLMATFGAPVSGQNHQLSAWLSVQAVLQFLTEFRKRHPQHESINVGMGMHCGEVLVGNIGTENRKQFSISGTTVIIASRIEQLNKEYQSTLLMSRALFDPLKDQIKIFESLGKVKMKGLDEIEIVKIL